MVARAWSEPPAANGAEEDYCIWIAAVNSGADPAMVNLSITGLAGYNLPSAVNATTYVHASTLLLLRYLGWLMLCLV